jgi:hypothetical protein
VEIRGRDRQRNRRFFSGMLRGVSRPQRLLEVLPSSPEPPDQSGQYSIKGSLALIYAELVTGAQPITSVTWPVTICELRYSLGLIGSIHCVTGGVPVGS